MEVPRVAYDKLAHATRGEPSETIRARINAARERQQQRLAGARLACNADMGPAQLREFCPRFLRLARRRPSPDARGDAADAPQRAGVPPGFESVAHDGRIFAFGFGRRGGHPDAPSGGGVAV